ncbi:hypothetical protein N9K64_06270 [Rhodobacteraceae bacterium]|nr:hypothetical protein [Paracoccaceae bacterium]
MSVEQTFFVKAQNGKYLIDGDVAPNLELISGETYEFNLSDPSLSSHPLEFKLNGNSWDDGVQYSGTLGIDQKVTLTVPSISDGIVSYHCSNHSGMGNDLSITWNYITGTVGDDELYGGDGDDNLQSGSGDDELYGGAGNDEVYGEAGDDTILGGLGNDWIDGGDGNDRLAFWDVNYTEGIQVDLSAGTTLDQFGSVDTLLNIENANGTDFDDSLLGDSSDNGLDGNAGDDLLRGYGGSDSLWGREGDDEIYGGDDRDFLIGFAGNDFIDGESGNDVLRYDLDAKYGGILGVEVNLAQQTAIDGFGDADTVKNIYEVRGTQFDDTILGDDANNVLSGRAGDDTLDAGSGDDKLYGGDGNDDLSAGAGDDEIYGGAGYNWIDGGLGNDTLNGTDGVDTVFYSHNLFSEGIIVNNTGSNINGSNAYTAHKANGDSDELISIENFHLSDGNDQLFVDGIRNGYHFLRGGDDFFEAHSGILHVIPGMGNDTISALNDAKIYLDYPGSLSDNGIAIENGIRVSFSGSGVGTVSDDGWGFSDAFSGVYRISGNSLDDQMIGGEADVWFDGNAGADEIYGGKGDDKLYGGSGDDILDGGDGNDSLYGGFGTDDVFGGNGNDLIIHNHNAVNADGGAGEDTFQIDLSDETYEQQLKDLNVGIEVDFVQGTSKAFNLVTGDYFGAGDDTLINIENFEIIGSIPVTVQGNEVANKLYGGDGNDTITGGAGDDTLSGGSGSDTFIFDAGFGNDIITDFTHGLDELNFYGANGELLSSTDIIETQNEDGDSVLTVSDGSSVTLSGVSVYSLPFSIVSEKSGDNVTVSFYLDPDQDPGNAGVGSFNATVGFETGSLTYVSSSFADGLTGVPNTTEVDSGTLGLGGFGLTPVTDLATALFSVTFDASGTTEPVQLTLSEVEVDATSLSGGTYTFDLTGATLSGSIVTRSGTALPEVVLATDTGLSAQTSSSGAFEMDLSGSEQLLSGSLSFSNTGSTKAISAADALDALKLSVGLSTDAGVGDAFSLISADFDQNGRVTAADALEILKYSVGLTTQQDAKWVFVDTAGDYSDISKSNTSYTDGMSIADLSADTSVSLTGILIGDVNDSYSGLIA